MKANRKFRGQDEAVSPVIAVILMVAITVVLSATVYVWVSGFGGNHNQPSRSVTLMSDGPIMSGVKSFTVSAADPSLRYSDVTFTKNGATLTLDATCAPSGPSVVTLCRGPTVLTGAAAIQAGDSVKVHAAAGDVLRIVNVQANSVINTIAMG